MTGPDPVAQRAAELRARVTEHLAPGEAYLAGTWVTRASSRSTAVDIAVAELNPKRLAQAVALEAVGVDEPSTGPNAYEHRRRRIVDGGPGSHAVTVDHHVPDETTARALAVTERRLLLLAKVVPVDLPQSRATWWRSALQQAGDLLRNRPPTTPIPPLTTLWQCPRAELTRATAENNRLHLAFADGSTLTLVTPAPLARTFAEPLNDQSR